MADEPEDDGVHIELAVSIYGANERASNTVAEIALDAAQVMMDEYDVCGADVVVGLLLAATTLLELHDNEKPMH
jgi:hypothetical protein